MEEGKVMVKEKPCKHEWIYDGRSCCYRLQCFKCSKVASAYFIKGKVPKIGDKVRLFGETIEIVK